MNSVLKLEKHRVHREPRSGCGSAVPEISICDLALIDYRSEGPRGVRAAQLIAVLWSNSSARQPAREVVHRIPTQSRDNLIWELGTSLRAVQDGQNRQAVALHLVRNEKRCTGDNQLSRSGFSPWAPEMRMGGEIGNRPANGSRNMLGRLGLVLLNVGLDACEVPKGCLRPNYMHAGGRSFRLPPQDLSQRSTFSWGTTRPPAASFSPSSISANCHC